MIADGLKRLPQDFPCVLDDRLAQDSTLQFVFGLHDAHGNRRYSAIGETRPRDSAGRIKINSESRGHGADIIHAALGHFKESHMLGKWFGQMNGNQKFAGGKSSLAISAEEGCQRNSSLAMDSANAELRIESEEKRRCIP